MDIKRSELLIQVVLLGIIERNREWCVRERERWNEMDFCLYVTRSLDLRKRT